MIILNATCRHKMIYAALQFICPSTYNALFAIHAQTEGKHWMKGHDWFLTENYCEWEGIKCGDNKQVIALDFSDFGLRAALPSEIGCFPKLQTLYLNNNVVTEFPADICVYTKTLQFLQMSRTGLTKLHPCICDFAHLKYLYIDSNQLSGALPQCQFPNLERMIASCNQFSGDIPESYG